MGKKSEVCLGELDHFLHDRAASGRETSKSKETGETVHKTVS